MKKILVIDDQPDNVFILQDRLEQQGYEVLSASDGPEGIEKANSQHPDLILLDVMMPGMSGFEVCKELVDSENTKEIPIILVTALTGSEDIKEGLQAGAFDYIKKPFNKTELLARINSALRYSETNKLLLEIEKIKTFAATVVTTNHEIKQPLTMINLSTAALRRELAKTNTSKENLIRRIEYIENATRSIIDVLDKLTSIKKPVMTDYMNNLQMVDLNSNEKAGSGK